MALTASVVSKCKFELRACDQDRSVLGLVPRQAAVKKVADELGDTGRILVRESGTESVIRVMVEAESNTLCEMYMDSVIKVIKAKGHLP